MNKIILFVISICLTLILQAQNNQLRNDIFTDIDGNIYHTIKIGNQTWMVENLKTTKYNDGTPIPNVKDNTAWAALTTGAYCWYNNDAANKKIYGALYNWYTVNTGKLAPKGWHVPTDAEWTSLTDYLTNNGYGYGGSGNYIAKSMAASLGWTPYTIAGTPGNDQASNNSSGFTALPGGFRYKSEYKGVGGGGSWWSSTDDDTGAFGRNLVYTYDRIFGMPYLRECGFSVRCVKDDNSSNNSVIISSPNSRVSWNVGDIHPITWIATGIDNVKIEYSNNNGTTWTTIVNDIQATSGSYAWTVPDTPSDSCLIKITSTTDDIVFDLSDSNFSIVSGQNPCIEAPDKSLLAWYPFNGNANDESGNGHNGIVNGATLIKDRFGNDNGAYNFDGNQDWITVNGLNGDYKKVAVSFWFKNPVATVYYPIYFWWENVASCQEGSWNPYRSGDIILLPGNHGLLDLSIPSFNEWHHVVVNIDFSNHITTIYLDNKKDRTLIGGTGWNIGSNGTNAGELTFGNNIGHGKNEQFTGQLDDIRIYNCILSDCEITALFKEGNNEIIIPNAFTPNGDGYNDYFEIHSKNMKELSVTIYDSGGVKIFDTKNFDGKWDGKTLGGRKAPDGVYFYFLTAAGTDNKIYERYGSVYLFRNVINVYPNPVHQDLKVKLSSTFIGMIDIEIFSLKGERVYSQAFDLKDEIAIPVSYLADGLYTLRVTGALGSFSEKFIKN